jgi:transketolase
MGSGSASPTPRAPFDAPHGGRLPALRPARAEALCRSGSPARRRSPPARRRNGAGGADRRIPCPLIGGSADLTGSNNTKTKATGPFSADDYAGRYVYYGIREFGMAAAMNGMALHGGVIPYGGTFLVFSDYCRNAIRLSALQQVPAWSM